MAIEPIKKVTIVGSAASVRRVMHNIHSLGMVEVADAADHLPDGADTLHRQEVSTEEADERIRELDFILNLMNTFAPERKGLLESMQPLPLVVEQHEIDAAVKEFNLEECFSAANELDELYRRTERAISELQGALKELGPIEDLPYRLADFHRAQRVRLIFGHIPSKDLVRLDASVEPWNRVAWEITKPGQVLRHDITPEAVADLERKAAQAKTVRTAFACLPEDEAVVRRGLAEIGFEEVRLPNVPGHARDKVRQVKADLAEYEQRMAQVAERVRRLAAHRRTLTILKAFWLSNRTRQLAGAKGLHGKWTHTLCGYIRAKDVPALQSALDRDFPPATVIVSDPEPGEDVPVSLSGSRFVRPLHLLVEMFGLPAHTAFDPSPFLLLNFYLFFGICFADVGYGLLLVLVGAMLVKKTAPYAGPNALARILLYGGFSTIVFGALLGSWFGDLYKPEYLGEGNILAQLQGRLTVLDPMGKPLEALAIALLIGIANQFYGIVLKAYGALRQGDWKAAVFDAMSWIVTLTGLVIMAVNFFADVPPDVFRLGKYLFLAGAVSLVMSQGRDVKNPIGRFLGGLVSLYGIMGSYGCTAFVGDVLSYGRLLALGLTSSIVAQTINMLAAVLKGIPFVGVFLFVVALVAGHTFNFAISLLGAFVHSMRLIFVEFFGRFYEGGARSFQPLGFDSPLCILKRSGEHQ